MACEGGCLGGGGQPIPITREILKKRAKAIYSEDTNYKIRKSHNNPDIIKIYDKYLKEGPCGKTSHKLLHTHYVLTLGVFQGRILR